MDAGFNSTELSLIRQDPVAILEVFPFGNRQGTVTSTYYSCCCQYDTGSFK
uniref:Uncharacterized protein n=1 Tax=Anguilla anguilla TaxID=7936 RepID=A0A0E9QL45_ANGAN